jgi:hypothetical protein
VVEVAAGNKRWLFDVSSTIPERPKILELYFMSSSFWEKADDHQLMKHVDSKRKDAEPDKVIHHQLQKRAFAVFKHPLKFIKALSLFTDTMQ